MSATLIVQLFVYAVMAAAGAAYWRFSFGKALKLRTLRRDGRPAEAECVGHVHPRGGVCAVFRYDVGDGVARRLVGPVEKSTSFAVGDRVDIVHDAKDPDNADLVPIDAARIRHHVWGGVAAASLLAVIAYAASGIG
ncbi:DUF3592 domain-containing protein [Streptomyces sp. NPDC047928]|uniref:DUF3592 domain-containing protein n=1 Tax=unclassified Streptomyces TaxID=2593676 RepID=UPI003724B700